MPHVFIGTPTANAFIGSPTATSIIGMVAQLERSGIRTTYFSPDGAVVWQARDLIADQFLSSPATHLLFVDSDMGFEASLVNQFLQADKPMIGAIYAMRELNYATIEKRMSEGATLQDAIALSHKFAVRLLDNKAIDVADGLCRVAGLGMGFCLIRREVFTSIAKANKNPLVYSAHGNDKPIRLTSYFREIDDLAGTRMSEDFSFCQRYLNAGGDVWAKIDVNIKHIGDFSFGVPYMARLEAAKRRKMK